MYEHTHSTHDRRRGLWARLGMAALAVALMGTSVIGSAIPAGAQAVKIQTRTELLPPNPLPAGVARNGHGRADIELEMGVRERLKLNVDDVEVIGDATDPEFCRGFYEAVLVKNGVEAPLPAFPGLIVVCLVAGDPQAETRGELNFDARLNAGDPGIDPRGATLRIHEVEPVRDPVTLRALPGLNGEPFQIAARGPVALEGVLK